MMAKRPSKSEPASPTLRNRANDAYDSARERATEAYGSAREKATEAYGSAREKAIEAYGSARERATVARARAGKGVGDAPLVALGGGLAIGAIIAALLPKSKLENRLLGDFSGRIGEGARAAATAARDAGREKLSELNITSEAGKSAVQNLIEGITEAAKSGGQAAASAVRNKG